MDTVQANKKIKIYDLVIDEEKILWGRGYKEVVIYENRNSIWANEEAQIEFEIHKDETMRIMSGDNWIYLPKESIPILKEAITEFEKVVK